jgi:hypothetical protein
VCFGYHSIDLKLMPCRSMFLCVGILYCELIWAIRHSAASVISPYWDPTTGIKQRRFLRKNFEDGNCPSPGGGSCIPVFTSFSATPSSY